MKNASKNIRHDLDKKLVNEQIEKALEKIEVARLMLEDRIIKTFNDYEVAKSQGKEGGWTRIPLPLEESKMENNEWAKEKVKKEMEYYSLVRVIELPQKGKRFILVYGDLDDETVTSGTGPFESFEKARDWFFTSGR